MWNRPKSNSRTHDNGRTWTNATAQLLDGNASDTKRWDWQIFETNHNEKRKASELRLTRFHWLMPHTLYIYIYKQLFTLRITRAKLTADACVPLNRRPRNAPRTSLPSSKTDRLWNVPEFCESWTVERQTGTNKGAISERETCQRSRLHWFSWKRKTGTPMVMALQGRQIPKGGRLLTFPLIFHWNQPSSFALTPTHFDDIRQTEYPEANSNRQTHKQTDNH